MESNNSVTPALTRRSLLAGVAIGAVAGLLPGNFFDDALTASAEQASPQGLAGEGTFPSEWGNGKAVGYLREWANNLGNHPYLADFTKAGYQGGYAPPTAETFGGDTVSVTEFGAKADGTTDDSGAFLSAIEALGENGGVVSIPAGRYLLEKPVIVTRNNVFLRGEGSKTTVLYFPNTLTDSFRPAPVGVGTAYSFIGGQIWFTSQGLIDGFPANHNGQRWMGGGSSYSVAEADRGSTTLTLTTTPDLSVGDIVLLELDVTADVSLLKAMCGDVKGADSYNWSTATSLIPGPGQFIERSAYRWPVRISAIDGKNITLQERTHLPIRAAWNPRISKLTQYITRVGVEGLTVENKLIPQRNHLQDPGSNGVCFSQVVDGWARDVQVVNTDVGFGLTAAKHITLTRTVVSGRASHHPYACRSCSHNNLNEYFTIEKPTVGPANGNLTHGINVEGFSSGNVWRQGVMSAGVFDSHRALPFDILRTAITSVNVGGVGGNTASGPNYGARASHWGVEITGSNSLGVLIDDTAPKALVMGVRGVTGPSKLAGPIPAPRESIRETFQGKVNPYDAWSAQRIITGLNPEPQPKAV